MWFLPALLFVLLPLTWWRERRLYGRQFPRALRLTVGAVLQSGARLLILAAVFQLFLSMAAAATMALPIGGPLLSTLLTGFVLYRTLRPPAVIVLGTSRGGGAVRDLTLEIAWTAARGHRVVYFLSKTARWSPNLFTGLYDMTDNFHLASDDNWESVVFPLLDVVPIVVVDAREFSEGFLSELARIDAKPSLLEKTYVLPDDFARAYLRVEMPRLSTRTSEAADIFKAVESAMVAVKRARQDS